MKLLGMVLAALLAAPLAVAQTPEHPPPARPAPAGPASDRPAQDRPAPRVRLPPAAVTHHTLVLPDRTLTFTATAGSVVIPDAQGAPEAELAFIAYQLDGADAPARPVTFAVNGGPGFASAWLQLGAMGPWRVGMGGPDDPGGGVPSAAPALLPNAETWLDFTDLVFLDPAGTGYSRIDGNDEARRRLWSVGGDIDSLAEMIRRWLESARRVGSPKYLVGESYGGFRVPRLARALQGEQGIGVNGLVLVSPLLDSGGRSAAFDPLFWTEHLPSMVAVARARGGPVTRETLADAEDYAAGDYLRDQLRGDRDAAAMDRIAARVAALTGLDPALVRRQAGRISPRSFLREIDPGRVASIYDATLSAPEAFPANPFATDPEPSLARLTAPFTSAMLEVYGRLNWHPDALYELQNTEAGRRWDWKQGSGSPESVTALRAALAVDPGLRVLVAHGLFDLITPYFATSLMLAHLPDFGAPDRVRLVTYAGGHMFYSRDAARAGFRDEGRRLMTTD